MDCKECHENIVNRSLLFYFNQDQLVISLLYSIVYSVLREEMITTLSEGTMTTFKSKTSVEQTNDRSRVNKYFFLLLTHILYLEHTIIVTMLV